MDRAVPSTAATSRSDHRRRCRQPVRPVRSVRVVRVAVLAVALSMAVAGCRMGVDTRVEVEASGHGVVTLDVDLDQELLDVLTVTGFDPAPPAVDGWEVTRTALDVGERIAVTATFDDPGQLADRVADLRDGLTDDDPRLVESVDLVVGDDGSTELDATVGVWLPSSTGVEGPGFADAEDLAALAADPDAFAATFTVVLPGDIVEHNADVVRGSTATWQLAPGEVVEARVTAEAPNLVGGWVLTAIGVAVLVLVVLLGVWLLRRRRRERHVAPHGRVERLRG